MLKKGDMRAPFWATEQIGEGKTTARQTREADLSVSLNLFIRSLSFVQPIFVYPVFPVKMSDDGEQNPPPFHDVPEDTLLSSDENEHNPTLSDDGEEDALASLGVHCNDHLPLQELKMALTEYAKGRNFQVIYPSHKRLNLFSCFTHPDPKSSTTLLPFSRYEETQRGLSVHVQVNRNG